MLPVLLAASPVTTCPCRPLGPQREHHHTANPCPCPSPNPLLLHGPISPLRAQPPRPPFALCVRRARHVPTTGGNDHHIGASLYPGAHTGAHVKVRNRPQWDKSDTPCGTRRARVDGLAGPLPTCPLPPHPPPHTHTVIACTIALPAPVPLASHTSLAFPTCSCLLYATCIPAPVPCTHLEATQRVLPLRDVPEHGEAAVQQVGAGGRQLALLEQEEHLRVQ